MQYNSTLILSPVPHLNTNLNLRSDVVLEMIVLNTAKKLCGIG